MLKYIIDTLRENGYDLPDKSKTVDLIRSTLGGAEAGSKYFRGSPATDAANRKEDFGPNQIDLNYIFECFSDEHWLMRTSIFALMNHTFLSMDHPLFSPVSFREQISPDVILEKITYLVVCLYAMSTENRFLENKDDTKQSKESPVVHKETALIAPRFQNFDLSSKMKDVSEEEMRRNQRNKLLRKQMQVNQKVTRSEFLLGLAVQFSYLFLDPQMPFVSQIFNIFRAFYMDLPTAINEEEETPSYIPLYLKTFKGGRTTRAIIPVLRKACKPKKNLGIMPRPVTEQPKRTYMEDREDSQEDSHPANPHGARAQMNRTNVFLGKFAPSSTYVPGKQQNSGRNAPNSLLDGRRMVKTAIGTIQTTGIPNSEKHLAIQQIEARFPNAPPASVAQDQKMMTFYRINNSKNKAAYNHSSAAKDKSSKYLSSMNWRAAQQRGQAPSTAPELQISSGVVHEQPYSRINPRDKYQQIGESDLRRRLPMATTSASGFAKPFSTNHSRGGPEYIPKIVTGPTLASKKLAHSTSEKELSAGAGQTGLPQKPAASFKAPQIQTSNQPINKRPQAAITLPKQHKPNSRNFL